jgi:hypothetical protein
VDAEESRRALRVIYIACAYLTIFLASVVAFIVLRGSHPVMAEVIQAVGSIPLIIAGVVLVRLRRSLQR